MKKILGLALAICFIAMSPLASQAAKKIKTVYDSSLEVPENLMVVDRRSTTIHLVWDEAEEANRYELKLMDSKSNVLGYLRSKMNYKTISSKWLQTNKNYNVVVRSISGNLASEWSEAVGFRTKPQKVKNVLVSNITENSALVSWKACRGSDLKYIVKLTDGNNELVSKNYVNARKINLTGLDSNTVYKVRVQAQNARFKSDKGALSDEVLFETL